MAASKTEEDVKHLTCMFCDYSYKFCEPSKFEEYLHHLLTSHKFVIGEFDVITDFPEYIKYWKSRFQDNTLEEFCTVIRTNSDKADVQPSEIYYFLCDKLTEDRELRAQLQTKKLCEVLEQQQQEREDVDLEQLCLFCRHSFKADRAAVFHHMSTDHNFHIGHPDNLVYIKELHSELHDKMNKLLCLFCEKTFRDRHTLKEHMRKKQHKRINPQNRQYDKYYVVNYLEIGKKWGEIQSENDSEPELSNMADDWDELTTSLSEPSSCLFCPYLSEPSAVFEHMKESHDFDFEGTEGSKLKFHEKVKVVNYIRKQIVDGLCPTCEKNFDVDAIEKHFTDHVSCTQVPCRKLWDDPQYFFSTNENDSLLCALEDFDKPDSADCTIIIPEEIPIDALKEQSILCSMKDIDELR